MAGATGAGFIGGGGVPFAAGMGAAFAGGAGAVGLGAGAGGTLATAAVFAESVFTAATVAGGAWALANSVTGFGGGGLKPAGAA